MTRAFHHFILFVLFVCFRTGLTGSGRGTTSVAGSKIIFSGDVGDLFRLQDPLFSASNTAELSEVPKRHRRDRVSLHAHKTQLEFCFRDSGGSSLVTICIIHLNFRVKAFQHDPFLPLIAKLNCAPELILACIRVLTNVPVDHDDAAL